MARKAKNAAAVALGRLGGLKGGKARAAKEPTDLDIAGVLTEFVPLLAKSTHLLLLTSQRLVVLALWRFHWNGGASSEVLCSSPSFSRQVIWAWLA